MLGVLDSRKLRDPTFIQIQIRERFTTTDYLFYFKDIPELILNTDKSISQDEAYFQPTPYNLKKWPQAREILRNVIAKPEITVSWFSY